MFFKNVMIVSVNLDANNFEMLTPFFKEPYEHTTFLTRGRLLFRTPKSTEGLKEYDSEEIKLMHQTITSKRNITQLKSRVLEFEESFNLTRINDQIAKLS